MNLAFCLFKYFPYGGLQRDFLRLLEECTKRGHSVTVYTREWQGEKDAYTVKILPSTGWQNHTRNKQFVSQLKKELSKTQYDLIVGFNKMPGLDIYYAADPCYQTKLASRRRFWDYLLPRQRQAIQYEESVFGKDYATEIFLIAPQQQKEFQHFYGTPANRFHLLPPGIAKNRVAPVNAAEIRKQTRAKWKVESSEHMLLMVGSGFKTKGLDRIIKGIAALPKEMKASLWVIGDDKADSFKQLAKKYNLSERVHFLGGRDDVPEFLLAADLLAHPAYRENTGTVLLEAMVAGLPVLTTDVCGYAMYVEQANAGKVLASPFDQAEFNQVLVYMLSAEERKTWQENGILFAKTADIYHMPERAVDTLELLGQP